MTEPHEHRRQRRQGILTWLWGAWPWMNWALPLVLIAHGVLAAYGGWMWFMLIFSAPLTVGVSVLAGWFPRRILRRKGYTALTGPISIFLLTYWWSVLAAIALFVDRIAQEIGSETVPSVIRLFGDPAIDLALEGWLLAAALVLAGLSWAVVCALSISAPTPGEDAPSWGKPAAWAAAVGVPLVFVVALIAGTASTSEQGDSDGESVGIVNARSIGEQADRALGRYDEFQRQVAAVRSLIAAEGWMTAPPHGVDDDPEECRWTVDPCYTLTWAYSTAAPVDTEQLAAALPDSGWTITDTSSRGLTATTADGTSFELLPGVGDRWVLEASSPWWWGDGQALRDELADGEFTLAERGPFTADEWPPLPR